VTDEQDPKAGTDIADTPDTGDGGTGGGDADSEGGEKRVTITSHEYVTLKASRESAKAQSDELAQLRAERATRGTPPTPASGEADDARKQVELRQDYIARLKAEANGGNEAAGALVAVHESALASEQRVVYRLEMFDVPEKERPEVRKFMDDHGLQSPALARQFMRGGQYDAVSQENARLRAELDRYKTNKPAVEGTRIVGEPAVLPKKTTGPEEVSGEEYVRRMNDPTTKVATLNARRNGGLIIKV
jgi:hypothetical protein